MHPRCAIGLAKCRVDLRADIAEFRLPDSAVETDAARSYPREKYAIAFFHVIDAIADAFDNSGAFVAEDAGKPGGHDAGDDGVIRMTHAAGGHADQHLAAFRFVELDILDAHGLIELVTDRG